MYLPEYILLRLYEGQSMFGYKSNSQPPTEAVEVAVLVIQAVKESMEVKTVNNGVAAEAAVTTAADPTQVVKVVTLELVDKMLVVLLEVVVLQLMVGQKGMPKMDLGMATSVVVKLIRGELCQFKTSINNLDWMLT